MIKKLMTLCVTAMAAMGAMAAGEQSAVFGDWYEAHLDNEATTCARWDDFWMGASVAIPVTGLASPISASDVVVTAGTYSEFGRPYVLTEAEMWNRYGAPVLREKNLGNVEFDWYDNVWQNWDAEEDGAYGYELSADIWPNWSQVSGRQWILIPTGVPRSGTHTFSVKINGVEHSNYVVSFVMAEDQDPVPYVYKVSAVVAEGCEVMGKVTGGKTAKAGTKLTLRATANKGYVFAGWDGPLDDAQDPRNPSISYVVGEDDAEFVAYFMPVGEDWVDVWMYCRDEYVTNEEISDINIDVDSGSLATIKVTGLPSGLKYTTKAIYDRNGDLLHEANTIYGTPTKSGVYTVTVTATTAGKKTDTYSAVIVVRKGGERMVKLTVPSWYDYETDADVVPGKVTGSGIYAEGKKVTLKATANKGFVFAGWMDVTSGDWLYSDVDYRSPSMPYTMTDSDMEIEAIFIPVGDDWVDVCMHCGVLFDEYVTNEKIPDIFIYVDSGSLATLKVTGLPTGLKYTAKPVYDRSGDLLHEANTIYGTPTKSGVYTVTVTATTAGKKTDAETAVIVVRTEGEKMIKLSVRDWYDWETDTSVVPGKVTGAGIYSEGKKVTLKATANRGFVFAGWWDVNGDDWLYGAQDYRSPSLSYIMADSDKEIEAIFVPAEEDSDIALYVDGNEITSNVNDNNFVAEGTTILPLQMDSISIPKAAVSGLPAGMKYTDKALTVKATKTEDAYNVPANAIYGTPTKPGLYTVTVKLTNTTIKKAIEKKFTIEVPNFTAADYLFRDDGEYYIANDVGEKYSMYVGVTEFELPKIRLNGSGTLKVSGLPLGLKYNAGTGAIEGIASKEGNYTVSLTVGGLVSTFTIEVKPLPDWVVGTFEGCGFDDPDFDGSRNIWTISKQGKVSNKYYCSDGNALIQETEQAPLTTFVDGVFVIRFYYQGSDRWGSYRGGGTYYISRSEVNGVEFGVGEGDYWGEETSSDGDYWEWEGRDYAVQNIWSKDTERDFLPEIYNGAEKEIDLTGWNEKTFDESNYWSEPLNRCSLRLKFGKNGAVTAAFYEPGASKATGTASATLMPYNRNGDTVEALLTIAIAPKGRHSITLALYLEIDTSYGIVYGDDIEVVDYLMEAE